MTKVKNKKETPIRRWLRKITQRKKPYRWYDVEHCGM